MRKALVVLSALLLCSGIAGSQAQPADAPRATYVEVEPNDSKATANPFMLLPGDVIEGVSTSSSTVGLDYFRVKTGPLPPGVYRHRLVITSTTVGHTGTIRGLTQSAGVINPTSDAAVQTSSTTTTPPRFNQWYGFGKEEEVYYRVTGTTSTTAVYDATLFTDPVTVTVVPGSFQAGPITITTAGQGHTTDTDMWVYNANLNAIPDYGNDDAYLQSYSMSTLTRNFTPGVYYLALSNYNVANNLPSPADDDYRSGSVMDFPDSAANSSTSTALNLQFSITDATGVPVVVPSTKTGPFDINWFQFTVFEPTTGACCVGANCLPDVSEVDCANMGGTYKGNGSTCGPPNPCVGACCFGITCVPDMLLGDCLAQGGVYKGDGTTCGPPNPCVGACCFPDGSCQETATETDCVNLGGVYQGDGTTCTPNTCPQPGNDCNNPLVIPGLPYADVNTTCGRVNDYSNTCLGSYDGGEDIIYTLILTEPMCIDVTVTGATSSDNWIGVLVDDSCPPDPTTCLAKATTSGTVAHLTVDLPAGTYTVMIDTYPSPTCIDYALDIMPCPTGACCLSSGACVPDLTQAQCTAQGGTWKGAGTDCFPNPCVPIDYFWDTTTGEMGGTGFNGEWIYYPEAPQGPWYNMWWPNEFALNRQKEIIYTFTVDFPIPGNLEVAANWATPDWQLTERPPFANEEQFIQRQFLAALTAPGTYTYTVVLPFCPRWVSLDIRGLGYVIEGTIQHICLPPPGGACCFQDGSCQETATEMDCVNLGGVYQGDGTTCTPNPCPQPGDNCGNPLPVGDFGPGSDPFDGIISTCGHGNDYTNTCLGSYDGGEDVVYVLDVVEPVCLTITVTGATSSDNWIGVLIDDSCPPDPTTCLAKGTSSSGTVAQIPGVDLPVGTYYIMIDTWPSPNCMNGNMVIMPCPTGACCLNTGECVPNVSQTQCTTMGGIEWHVGVDCLPENPCPQPPLNDDCPTAIAVSEGTPAATGNNRLASATDWAEASCQANSNKDVWYAYTASCDGQVVMDTEGSTQSDTVLSVYTTCAGPEIACDDDSGTGNWSRLTFAAVAGTTYYVRVASYSTGCGGFNLNIACDPVGACCIGSTCTPNLTLADCTTQGGIWQGAGTDCFPNPCTPLNYYLDMTVLPPVGGGDGYPGPGIWYEYPNGWWNQWWPNEFALDRQKLVTLTFEIYFAGAPVEVAFNFSSEAWPDDTAPPLPQDDPFVIRVPVDPPITAPGQYTRELMLPFCPRWVSVDVRGANFWIQGTITHICLPPVTGACCFLDGSCQLLTNAACLAAGGNYLGDGTGCDPNPCPQPGACCFADGHCEMSTVIDPGDCAPGGTYYGDNTVCFPNPCPPPLDGACCYPDGSCTITTQADCTALWLGPGTTCDMCPPPNDNCPLQTPVIEGVYNFDTTNATFDGPGWCMNGPNIWYCYVASCTGTATISLAGSAYNTMLGVYHDCTCYPTQPMTMCCAPVVCTIPVTATHGYLIEIGSVDGTAGPGVLTITCNAIGACCFPGSVCQVLPELDCAAMGGVFQGPGTVCDPNPCICVGDLNCDGQIDFRDINPFVLRLSNPSNYFAAYPNCPDGNGDINGSGSVGFQDINPFVALLTGAPLPIICGY